jgi:Rieske Fe-S protein
VIQFSRRTVLAAACAGCGGVALSACGGGSSAATSPAAPSPAAPSPTAPSPAASPGAPLARLADLPIGTSVSVQGPDGKAVLVTRTSETTAVAFSAVCTHQGCAVEPAGANLGCPCHDSTFDGTTGAVLTGPAPAPLPQIRVAVRGGAVVLA